MIDKVAKTPEDSFYHAEATDEHSLIHSAGFQDDGFVVDEEPAFTTRVMKSSRRHGRRSVSKYDDYDL